MTRAELLRGGDLLLEERERHLYRYRAKRRRLEVLEGPAALVVAAGWAAYGVAPWWHAAAVATLCMLAAALHVASTVWAARELLEAERLLARGLEQLPRQRA